MTFGMNFLIFKFINTRDCIEELDGIKICIYNEVYGQHNLPHIYAKYCDYEVSVRIPDGEMIIGNFHIKKAKMLKKWVLSDKGQRKIKEKWNELNQNGIIVSSGLSKGFMPKK